MVYELAFHPDVAKDLKGLDRDIRQRILGRPALARRAPEASVAYIENAQNRPGFGDSVSQMKMPCLICAGDRDRDPHIRRHRSCLVIIRE